MFKNIHNLIERMRIEKEIKELKNEYYVQRDFLDRLLKLVDQIENNENNPFCQILIPEIQKASDSLIKKEVDILELELHLEDLK